MAGEMITIALSEFNRLQERITEMEKDREKAVQTMLDLCHFSPGVKPLPFDESNDSYENGDEQRPFLSDRVLYSLIGKEEARTILTLTDNVYRALLGDEYWQITGAHYNKYARYDLEINFNTFEEKNKVVGAIHAVRNYDLQFMSRKNELTLKIVSASRKVVIMLRDMYRTGDCPDVVKAVPNWTRYLQIRREEQRNEQ